MARIPCNASTASIADEKRRPCGYTADAESPDAEPPDPAPAPTSGGAPGSA